MVWMGKSLIYAMPTALSHQSNIVVTPGGIKPNCYPLLIGLDAWQSPGFI